MMIRNRKIISLLALVLSAALSPAIASARPVPAGPIHQGSQAHHDRGPRMHDDRGTTPHH